MGEVKFETCTTIAVRYRFVVRENTNDGSPELSYQSEPLLKIDIEEVATDESNEDADESEFEDDVDFLRSLDPKEWKDQDHYRVLGIKNLRHKATEDDLKKAYRKMVLKHHPDKRKALGEEIRPDDDYFTCITKAYEILGVPNKRRSYDSVDPFFDDSIPTAGEIKKGFFEVFPLFFKMNVRWSEKKPVPLLGGPDTNRESVEKFYSFWYNFESWREFSYLDEEEKEKGQDRDERRWIEKQNKVARAKRKKEEMARIRSLVDMAYNADPRIAKFKQDDKDKKLAVKRAKQSAVQARKEEEERLQREAKLAQEKTEAEERARMEAKRQERENQKKALKRERKIFRDACKENSYYCDNNDENLTHMTAIEKICEVLKLEELEKLNIDLKMHGKSSFIEAMEEMEKRVEAERIAHLESRKKSDNNNKAKTASKTVAEWTEDHLQLLIKAVNLFPAGTNQRWEVVANFINQHGQFGDMATFTSKEVLAKAKDLQNTDFSKSNLKLAANKQAYSNFEKDKQNARVIDNAQISENIDSVNKAMGGVKQPTCNGNANVTSPMENDVNCVNGMAKVDTPWTPAEQQLLEQALKTYSNATPDRWERIAECLPSRTKKECMRRYKELVEIIKAKKAAHAALKTK